MDAARIERDLAAYYDQEAGERAERALLPQRIAMRHEFAASLRGTERLLEIGIGPGRDATAFVERGIAVTGVDLSTVFAALASAAGAQIALATARALPFRDRAFDVVWTMSTLMHIPESAIGGALAEVRRVLKPGGVASIGVWGGADVENLLPGSFDPPRLFSRRSDDRWQQLVSVIGDVERFETWHEGDEEFWYQWAIVRRT